MRSKYSIISWYESNNVHAFVSCIMGSPCSNIISVSDCLHFLFPTIKASCFFFCMTTKTTQSVQPYSAAACRPTGLGNSSSLLLLPCRHAVQIWAISISALSTHSVNTVTPSVGWIPLNTLQSLTALDREARTEDWPPILKGWCFMGCQSSNSLCWLSLQRIWSQNDNWFPKNDGHILVI